MKMNNINFSRHQAEAVLVTCVDFRFHQPTVEFVKNNLAGSFDLLTTPGATKNLVEANQSAKEIIRVIKEVSLPLHQIKKIILMNHWDCGGYGGSRSFSSIQKEEEKYQEDLKKARGVLKKEFPEMEIIIGYSQLDNNNLKFIIINN